MFSAMTCAGQTELSFLFATKFAIFLSFLFATVFVVYEDDDTYAQ